MIENNIYFCSEFHLLPEVPGIYSWHFYLSKPEFVQGIHYYDPSKKFDIQMEGNLKEKYTGSVQANPLPIDFHSLNYEILEKCSISFLPPIYIGISKNLKSRLSLHLEHLETACFSRKIYDFDVNDSSEINPDSDQESSYFGERVGKFLQNSNIRNTQALFVKIVQISNDISRKELIACEYYLNRTVFPLFGRK